MDADDAEEFNEVPIIHNPIGIGRLTRAAWVTIRKRMQTSLLEHGYHDIGSPQFNVLLMLSQGPMGQTALNAALGISKQGLSYLLDSLETGGYIVRMTDASNRRQRVVQLTQAGEEVTALMREAAFRFEEDVRNRIGAIELEAYRNTLRIITSELDTLPAT
jgi:DNA-binding MarR family transcriptional regulator